MITKTAFWVKQKLLQPRSFRTAMHRLMLFATIPLIVCIIVLLIIFISTNRQYNNTLMNLSIASSFNADFQTTIDSTMYQVVINQDMFEVLRPMDDIYYAQEVVGRLQETSTDIENLSRLTEISGYLELIAGNISVIVDDQGYEQNMRILDEEIRALTMLVHQIMQDYIYYETRFMAEVRDDANREFILIIALFSGIFIVITIAIVIVGFRNTKRLTEPLNELSENFKTVGKGDFSIRPINATSTEVRVLQEAFGTMVSEIQGLVEHIAKEKDNLRLIEFQLLQAQINPHFLYNTFDAIIWLTEDGEYEKVKKMMGSLSDFCRIALSDGEDVITIGEEIKHIQSYLEIQQIRYFDVLSYEIDVPVSVKGYLIPKLSLQPIVENALYHGIKHKRGGGEIKIECRHTDSFINISIRDTGIGMTDEQLKSINNMITTSTDFKQGYGLVNVFERLRLYYHEEVTIAVSSVYNDFTEVSLTIPTKIL